MNEPDIMQYFTYEHLPAHLQQVSRPICELAEQMCDLPDGPEKSAGLRKLLEAKDCFVRARLSKRPDPRTRGLKVYSNGMSDQTLAETKASQQCVNY